MNEKKTERILIVDDEEVMQTLLFDILSDGGYSVITASSGKSALLQLEKGPVDLVLTDIMMPEMDGLELMDNMRQQYPEIIIMVMTGYGSLETARTAMKKGASDYIMKPFNLDEIRMSVKRILEKSKILQENTRLKEMIPLFEVSEALGSSIHIESLLHLILSSALGQTGATRGSLMLIDDAGDGMSIQASVGIEKEIVEATHIKVGEGISGKVAKEGKPLLITNVTEHPLFDKLSHNFPDKSFLSIPLVMDKDEEFLSIPLKTEKKILGVLNLNREMSGKAFTEGDLKLVSILASQAAISITNARLIQSLEESYLNTMQSFTLILEGKSPFTRGHSERVTQYSIEIAQKMKLSSEEITILRYGATLHDIGKIGVKDNILNKEGKLTDDEYENIKQHPLIGYDMVKPIKFLEKSISIIRSHHERMDGKGYPDGIPKENLSLLVRIVILADAYDAMMSDRPYRKALSKKEVFAEIERHAGTQFDEEVVEFLVR